jgi:hypothetical protein
MEFDQDCAILRARELPEMFRGVHARRMVACNGAAATSENVRRERRSAEVGKTRRSGGAATGARHRPPPRVHSPGTPPLPSLSSGYTIGILRA